MKENRNERRKLDGQILRGENAFLRSTVFVIHQNHLTLRFALVAHQKWRNALMQKMTLESWTPSLNVVVCIEID